MQARDAYRVTVVSMSLSRAKEGVVIQQLSLSQRPKC